MSNLRAAGFILSVILAAVALAFLITFVAAEIQNFHHYLTGR